MKKRFSFLMFMAFLFTFCCIFIAGCGGDGGSTGSVTQSESTVGYSDGILIKNNAKINDVTKMVMLSEKYLPAFGGSPALAPGLNRAIAESVSGYLGGSQYNFSASLQPYDQSGRPKDNPASPYELSKVTLACSGGWGQYALSINGVLSNIVTSVFVQGSHWAFSAAATYSATYSNGAGFSVKEATNLNFSAYVDLGTGQFNYQGKSGSTTLTGSDGWSVEINFANNSLNGVIRYNGVPQGALSGSASSITITDYESKEAVVVNI